ncbi:MAG TPA: family 1 glycosylhydrolase [Caulobacteraceae bacterium]
MIDNCTREWPPLGSIVEALQGLHSAIADGVGVRGYFYWSLLDDFERIMGYGPRFGLIRIDRQPMRRAISPPRSS